MTCECIKVRLGYICVAEENGKVVSIEFQNQDKTNGKIQKEIKDQILEYLAGKRKIPDFPVDPKGTDFQKKVWQALREIPYGTVISYGELAKKLNTSARAIGQAVGRNPLPIYFPCHRVVAKNSLGGFSSGIKWKKFLLEVEGYSL
ncbi:methylated-DNA--[protein]-cysteine S-methyltransferase [Pseudothermotoga thermarum]|uniref:Methylated-DNA--protein-cysteine methyltransferase n=1 Tax=Pseudothermotoga thermarum DSM 5069 TaxID=688269 RepID=F7YWS9_9THEM|nr:methylated-DNA--[protein]-cysteine S-methyltransferase [Pseudothermotoga thermarum]AEH50313.1 methylated-DNA/protein-cysteine methyltransferase [Pseudothermotoga thermarum DSM 5069]